ncbi:conjugative relaxase domain-containing protein, TrwC/TraI family [Desulfuromusa kysingii]|uniref:Conjugative relaxase domain-containing protein, TrwC/TraI family n=1 Tax=Desulfuromusa kysingii TaxID=37625 RepID=A0A1H3YZQ7_9BACT|nr:MobF family relaxase [Desulfuromusa kysingii]SEA16582.1 conjugative relaxase domain-containing protein, TrwC/TraI family [Desulfuromusa kysingii]
MFKPTTVAAGRVGIYYSDTRHDPGYYLRSNQGYQIYGSGVRKAGFWGPAKESHFQRFEELAGDKRKTKCVDLTLSSPKSVSMAVAYGNRKQRRGILKGRENAIKKTLKYLEKNGYIRVRRKENGVEKSYPAEGIVFLDVLHLLSRNLDPQIHNHVLLANHGYVKGDPKSYALDFTPLYKHQKQITQIFRSFERVEMEKLGFGTRTKYDKKENVSYELDCVTNEQIKAESSRSKDILEYLAKDNLTRETATSEQLQKATLRTRKAKVQVDRETMEVAFEARAKSQGYEIKETEGFTQVTQIQADRLTLAGLEKLIDSRVTYTRQDIVNETIKVAAAEGLAVDADMIKRSMAKAFKKADVFKLPGQQVRKVATAEDEFISLRLLRSENRNDRWMKDSQGTRPTLASRPEIEFQVDCAANRILNFVFEGEQKEAAINILESTDMISGIQGDPGTGKTTLLQVVAEVFGRDRMLGLAVSGVASKKLADETGMQGATTAKFLTDYEKRQRALKLGGSPEAKSDLRKTTYLEFLEQPYSMIVVDEASMVGEVQADKLAQIAKETGARLILVGDTKQLQAVAPGSPFERWQQQGMKTSFLQEIRRQEKEVDKKAVEAVTLRESAKEAVEIIKTGKGLEQIDEDEKRLQKTVDYWMERREATGRDPLLITGLNRDKDALNEAIRERLGLAGTGQTFTVLTSDDKIVDREFAPNDRIVFLKADGLKRVKTSDDHKILNGEQAVIMDIEGDKFRVAMLDENGKRNGVTAFFYIKEYQKIDSAYSLTIHKSQGQSIPDAIYSIRSNSALLNKNEFLVGISRHKQNLKIFTDDIEKMQIKADQWGIRESGLNRFLAGVKAEMGGSHFINGCRVIVESQQIFIDGIEKIRKQLIAAYGSPYKAPKVQKEAFEGALNKARENLRINMQALRKRIPAEPNPVENRLTRQIKVWSAKMLEIEEMPAIKGREIGLKMQKLNAADRKLIEELTKALPEKNTIDFKSKVALKTIQEIRQTEIDFSEIRLEMIEDESAEELLIDELDSQDDDLAPRSH